MPGNLDDLFDDPYLREQLLRRLEQGWSFEKIEPMSTEQIFARLNRLGIPVTPQDYRLAAQRHEAAQAIADEWVAQHKHTLRPERPDDDDFVWMAAIVLWKRLVPDRISFEQIDARMQVGYTLLQAERTSEACDAWQQVWEWLKDKLTPERNTLEALDHAFRGTQSIFNWCQDYEMELGHAGARDPKYLHLRVQYCREFLETVSGLEWYLQGNFLRAEADSYWRLGDIEIAEAMFEALIQANPDWPWGYIDWADLYSLPPDSPQDYARAETILRRALDRRRLEERDVVRERLTNLRAERVQRAPAAEPKPKARTSGKRRKKKKRK